ncbi:glucokinase [uncultured Roseovarius sp.]|uniref:glucokinase n=1 Tax=uncultured Roseovarius sp. TaxID=293344 RepID=UPI00260AF8BF|nr:glucokinase [uncultured Roseovarius sp.]
MPAPDDPGHAASAAWLVADVGASHSRLALATTDGLCEQSAQRVRNTDYPGFEQVVAQYLAHQDVRPTAICAGVAGPVRDGISRLTNLGWVIDAGTLASGSGIRRVHLINDLQAQAHALDDLKAPNVQTLFAGQPTLDGPRMVMGLGTGSNIAVAYRLNGALFVPAAEAGHSGLPHLDDETNALITALERQVSHKPYEALLSGPGLARLHRLRTGVEMTPTDIVAGYEISQPACVQSLEMFARILGAVMGNLALAHMSTGGVFLIGGLARAIALHLANLPFYESFVSKGPYRDIMQAMPIHIVSDDHAALLGCAQYLRAQRG